MPIGSNVEANWPKTLLDIYHGKKDAHDSRILLDKVPDEV
jgi:hypothetical protein